MSSNVYSFNVTSSFSPPMSSNNFDPLLVDKPSIDPLLRLAFFELLESKTVVNQKNHPLIFLKRYETLIDYSKFEKD